MQTKPITTPIDPSKPERYVGRNGIQVKAMTTNQYNEGVAIFDDGSKLGFHLIDGTILHEKYHPISQVNHSYDLFEIVEEPFKDCTFNNTGDGIKMKMTEEPVKIVQDQQVPIDMEYFKMARITDSVIKSIIKYHVNNWEVNFYNEVGMLPIEYYYKAILQDHPCTTKPIVDQKTEKVSNKMLTNKDIGKDFAESITHGESSKLAFKGKTLTENIDSIPFGSFSDLHKKKEWDVPEDKLIEHNLNAALTSIRRLESDVEKLEKENYRIITDMAKLIRRLEDLEPKPIKSDEEKRLDYEEAVRWGNDGY